MQTIFGVNGSQVLYNLAFTFGGTGLVLWAIFKFGVHKSIEEHMTELRAEFKPICDDLQKIKYQLYNNGGESMKDAIDRIEKDAVELKINQAIIKAKLEG